MELPIPSHLKKYFVLDENEQSEFEVNGCIRCRCGCNRFEIFSSNERELINLRCAECGEEFILFDSGKHGWNGYVCKDDFLNREEPFEQYVCEQCDNNYFSIKVNISSQGKQDFIEECVNNDDSYSEDEWVDGFEWIRVSFLHEMWT